MTKISVTLQGTIRRFFNITYYIEFVRLFHEFCNLESTNVVNENEGCSIHRFVGVIQQLRRLIFVGKFTHAFALC
jgi:hypothetical protein